MSEPIPSRIDPRVDAALAELPPATLPPALVMRTMAQVAREGAATAAGPRYRPRFDWWGLALPGLGILLVAASVGLAVGSLNRLDPLWLARMGLSARLQWQSLAPLGSELGLGLFGLATAMLLGLALALLALWDSGGLGRAGGFGRSGSGP